MTKRDSISAWLFQSLRNSSTIRIILRDLRQTGSPNNFEAIKWLQEVAKYWNQDEAATGQDQIYEQSDGAVDSRDSLKFDPYIDARQGKTRKHRRKSRINRRHQDSSRKKKGASIGVIGVCALDVKARSKPSRMILNRLISRDEFEVVVFGDKVILDEAIDNWPICDFLICFYSDGFPLEKAIDNSYLIVALYFGMLDHLDVPTPPRLEINRDGGPSLADPYLQASLEAERKMVFGKEPPPRKIKLIDDGDALWIDGAILKKPFVELPVSHEDQNIWIYYPQSQGGGARKCFRKVGKMSSEFDADIIVPRSIQDHRSSYIYYAFLPPDNAEDVKAYTIGPDYCHAETRKSPRVDGLVRRNTQGRELRYVTSLSREESTWAKRIVEGFKQRVCGFDILRSSGNSYVLAVNGWSFVKDNEEYYDKCAEILSELWLKVARDSSSEW